MPPKLISTSMSRKLFIHSIHHFSRPILLKLCSELCWLWYCWTLCKIEQLRNGQTFFYRWMMHFGWISFITWLSNQMETFSASLVICAENSPVTGEFHTQWPVTRSFDVFLDLRLNERMSKQSWGWWFDTTSRPLWRYSNDKSPQ